MKEKVGSFTWTHDCLPSANGFELELPFLKPELELLHTCTAVLKHLKCTWILVIYKNIRRKDKDQNYRVCWFSELHTTVYWYIPIQPDKIQNMTMYV